LIGHQYSLAANPFVSLPEVAASLKLRPREKGAFFPKFRAQRYVNCDST